MLGFHRSTCGRILVTGVRHNGRAHRTGVKAGDELKSVNDWKCFGSCPTELIHASLVAPVTLVLVGFVGKLQAEVQVDRSPEYMIHAPGLASDRTILPEEEADEVGHRMMDEIFFPAAEAELVMEPEGIGFSPALCHRSGAALSANLDIQPDPHFHEDWDTRTKVHERSDTHLLCGEYAC